MYTGTLAAASNRADLKFTVELVDPATDDFVDLTGATIKVAIREQEALMSLLTGSTTITGDGTFDVDFALADMATLKAGFYDIGITVLLATGVTYQLLAGVLPVADGVVDQ